MADVDCLERRSLTTIFPKTNFGSEFDYTIVRPTGAFRIYISGHVTLTQTLTLTLTVRNFDIHFKSILSITNCSTAYTN